MKRSKLTIFLAVLIIPAVLSASSFSFQGEVGYSTKVYNEEGYRTYDYSNLSDKWVVITGDEPTSITKTNVVLTLFPSSILQLGGKGADFYLVDGHCIIQTNLVNESVSVSTPVNFYTLDGISTISITSTEAEESVFSLVGTAQSYDTLNKKSSQISKTGYNYNSQTDIEQANIPETIVKEPTVYNENIFGANYQIEIRNDQALVASEKEFNVDALKKALEDYNQIFKIADDKLAVTVDFKPRTSDEVILSTLKEIVTDYNDIISPREYSESILGYNFSIKMKDGKAEILYPESIQKEQILNAVSSLNLVSNDFMLSLLDNSIAEVTYPKNISDETALAWFKANFKNYVSSLKTENEEIVPIEEEPRQYNFNVAGYDFNASFTDSNVIIKYPEIISNDEINEIVNSLKENSALYSINFIGNSTAEISYSDIVKDQEAIDLFKSAVSNYISNLEKPLETRDYVFTAANYQFDAKFSDGNVILTYPENIDRSEVIKVLKSLDLDPTKYSLTINMDSSISATYPISIDDNDAINWFKNQLTTYIANMNAPVVVEEEIQPQEEAVSLVAEKPTESIQGGEKRTVIDFGVRAKFLLESDDFKVEAVPFFRYNSFQLGLRLPLSFTERLNQKWLSPDLTDWKKTLNYFSIFIDSVHFGSLDSNAYLSIDRYTPFDFDFGSVYRGQNPLWESEKLGLYHQLDTNYFDYQLFVDDLSFNNILNGKSQFAGGRLAYTISNKTPISIGVGILGKINADNTTNLFTSADLDISFLNTPNNYFGVKIFAMGDISNILTDYSAEISLRGRAGIFSMEAGVAYNNSTRFTSMKNYTPLSVIDYNGNTKAFDIVTQIAIDGKAVKFSAYYDLPFLISPFTLIESKDILEINSTINIKNMALTVGYSHYGIFEDIKNSNWSNLIDDTKTSAFIKFASSFYPLDLYARFDLTSIASNPSIKSSFGGKLDFSKSSIETLTQQEETKNEETKSKFNGNLSTSYLYRGGAYYMGLSPVVNYNSNNFSIGLGSEIWFDLASGNLNWFNTDSTVFDFGAGQTGLRKIFDLFGDSLQLIDHITIGNTNSKFYLDVSKDNIFSDIKPFLYETFIHDNTILVSPYLNAKVKLNTTSFRSLMYIEDIYSPSKAGFLTGFRINSDKLPIWFETGASIDAQFIDNTNNKINLYPQVGLELPIGKNDDNNRTYLDVKVTSGINFELDNGDQKYDLNTILSNYIGSASFNIFRPNWNLAIASGVHSLDDTDSRNLNAFGKVSFGFDTNWISMNTSYRLDYAINGSTVGFRTDNDHFAIDGTLSFGIMKFTAGYTKTGFVNTITNYTGLRDLLFTNGSLYFSGMITLGNLELTGKILSGSIMEDSTSVNKEIPDVAKTSLIVGAKFSF